MDIVYSLLVEIKNDLVEQLRESDNMIRSAEEFEGWVVNKEKLKLIKSAIKKVKKLNSKSRESKFVSFNKQLEDISKII